MIILGIDPGTANTGYGVIRCSGSKLRLVASGMIKTAASEELAARLATIHGTVVSLIEEHAPDVVAVEELYFGQNVGSAFAVGHARGVVLLAAGQSQLPCHSYTPQQVKGAVCGQGNAAKDQVQRMVQMMLGTRELPKPDHVADALAVAICHSNQAPLLAAIGGAQ